MIKHEEEYERNIEEKPRKLKQEWLLEPTEGFYIVPSDAIIEEEANFFIEEIKCKERNKELCIQARDSFVANNIKKSLGESMKVSNLRKIVDPDNFEPSVGVDVEIPIMVLYELNLLKEDIKKDVIYTIGLELLERIRDMQKGE